MGVRVLGEIRDQPHMHQVQEGVGQLGVTVGLSVERTERPETHCGPRRGEFAPGAPGRRPGVWVAKSCLSINATEKREARTVSKYVIVLVSERSTRRICVRQTSGAENDCGIVLRVHTPLKIHGFT